MASKKSNKGAKTTDIVASNPSNSEDKKVKELATSETQKAEAKADVKADEKKDEKKVEKKEVKADEKKALREERDEIKEKDDEVVDRNIFHPVRGSSRGRGGDRGAHRSPNTFQRNSNQGKEDNNEELPKTFRGRGNFRGGRGNFRGREGGNRSFDGKAESGRQGYVNPRDNPSTWFKVITHKSPEAWSHFLAKTQNSDVKHYQVMISDLRGEQRYAHPQEEEIKVNYCFSVDGHKGSNLYFVRGREYYVSMVPYSGGGDPTLGFTSSCASAKTAFSWLPTLKPGQTLHFRVNAAFPNHFYYQDTKERFIGGPVIVARNFEQKKKKRETTSGTCSDEEENSTDTQYDE